MIELPETYVLSEQINNTLVGKTILNVTANAHPHAFAWYAGDPAGYHDKLSGKKVTSSNPGTGYTCGGNTEIICEDMLLVISTPIKYHAPGDKLPAKHQLLIEFDDFSHMSCTVQMWGAMFCYGTDGDGLPEGYTVKKCPDPLTDAFDEAYFDGLWGGVKPNLSAKAFLATEQRIPGLGNGVLHDILWNAQIHPKRKLETLGAAEKANMYASVKSTLHNMRAQGGRDTERDLFGCKGGYKTVLSANTLKSPCTACGGALVREAYLGGNIYYCPNCQPATCK
ncbi:MAG: endonuclease VIII [Oscillospiraceae bacterium]|nr:endonuclease VIII [Oscillospiraceae bacterium]